MKPPHKPAPPPMPLTSAPPAPAPIAPRGVDPSPAVKTAAIVHPEAQAGRAPVEPDLLGTGVISGPGNQGSQNTAHMAGHAGTGADRLSIPRNLKFGTGTVTQ